MYCTCTYDKCTCSCYKVWFISSDRTTSDNERVYACPTCIAMYTRLAALFDSHLDVWAVSASAVPNSTTKHRKPTKFAVSWWSTKSTDSSMRSTLRSGRDDNEYISIAWNLSPWTGDRYAFKARELEEQR